MIKQPIPEYVWTAYIEYMHHCDRLNRQAMSLQEFLAKNDIGKQTNLNKFWKGEAEICQ